MSAIVRYVICPAPKGAGVLLTSPRLPFPLRYPDAADALDYAHWHARDLGGSIWLLDPSGYPVVTETVRPRDPHPLGG